MTALAPAPWCILAGDEEADRTLAGLVPALRAEAAARGMALPPLVGVGGEALHAAGMELGLTLEDLRRPSLLPAALRTASLVNEAAAGLRRLRPALILSAGWPEFALGAVEAVEGLGAPVVQIGGPTAWVWRANRGEKLARLVRRVLLFLPFEPPYFERFGVACSFVGHPVTAGGAGRGDAARFRADHGLDAAAPLLLVHAGGAGEDAARFLPAFAGAAHRLAAGVPGLRAVLAPTAETRAPLLRAAGRFPGPAILLEPEPASLFDAAAAARLALAAADHHTITLAACGLPMVVGHRIGMIAALFARRMMALPQLSLVNLLADAMAVPEFIQEGCTADRLGAALAELWPEGPARAAQLAATAAAVASLAPPGGEPFGRLVARAVLDSAAGLPPHSPPEQDQPDDPPAREGEPP